MSENLKVILNNLIDLNNAYGPSPDMHWSDSVRWDNLWDALLLELVKDKS